MTYEWLVRWGIVIDADSPEEAAREALEIQRDGGSLALAFDVIDWNGDEYTVDLAEER